jgi:predicted RNA methylase
LRAAGDVLGLESVSSFADQAGQQAADMAATVRGPQNPNAGILERGVYGGFESIGAMAPAIAAGVVTGNPATTLGIMGAQTGGEEYDRARDANVSTPQALAYATSQAAIEVATEQIPVSRLLGDLAKRTGLIQTLLRQAAAEVPGEQIATAFQDLNEWAVLRPDAPFADYLRERPSAAGETLVSTIVTTVGQTAGAAALDRVTRTNNVREPHIESAPPAPPTSGIIGPDTPVAPTPAAPPPGIVGPPPPVETHQQTVAPPQQTVAQPDPLIAEVDAILASDTPEPVHTVEGISAVDTLETGEQQPRLPGDAGAVRDQNIQTPAIDLPFSLTGEADPSTRGGQSGLGFDTPAPPAQTTPDEPPSEHGQSAGAGEEGREPVGGIAPSITGGPETPKQRTARRTDHYDRVFEHTLARAQEVDPAVDPADLRAEFDDRITKLEELDQLAEESGHDPHDLLRAVAKNGGIWWEKTGAYRGEIAVLKDGNKFGAVAGVNGVFRKGGRTPDDMVGLLRQDQRFEWIEDLNDLIDALDDAVRAGDATRGPVFPGTKELLKRAGIKAGEAWWKDSWRTRAAGLDQESDALDALEIRVPYGRVQATAPNGVIVGNIWWEYADGDVIRVMKASVDAEWGDKGLEQRMLRALLDDNPDKRIEIADDAEWLGAAQPPGDASEAGLDDADTSFDPEKFDAAARGKAYEDMSEAELKELFEIGVGDEQQKAAIELRRRQEAQVSQKSDTEPSITINGPRRSVEVKFAKKPSDEIRERLKKAGFRWAKSNGAWYKAAPGKEEQLAAQVREMLGVSETSAVKISTPPETSQAPEKTDADVRRLKAAAFDVPSGIAVAKSRYITEGSASAKQAYLDAVAGHPGVIEALRRTLQSTLGDRFTVYRAGDAEPVGVNSWSLDRQVAESIQRVAKRKQIFTAVVTPADVVAPGVSSDQELLIRTPQPEKTAAEKLAEKVMARLKAEQDAQPKSDKGLVIPTRGEDGRVRYVAQPKPFSVGDRVTADEGTGEIQRLSESGTDVKIALDSGGKLTNWIPVSRVRKADPAPKAVSYKAEISDGSGFSSNALRFPTRQDAEAYASELMSRWMAAKERRVVESDDPVTHVWDKAQYKHVRVEDAKPAPAKALEESSNPPAAPNADLDARKSENAKKREALIQKLRDRQARAGLHDDDQVREDVPDYERRPGTDRARSERDVRDILDRVDAAGRRAVSAGRVAEAPLQRRGGGAPRLQGLGITPALVRTHRLDIRGQQIRDIHDLASLAQVVRDPRTETLRFVYVKRTAGGHEVLATEALSSRLPDQSLAFLSTPQLRAFYRTHRRTHGEDLARWPPAVRDEYRALERAALSRFLADQRSRMARLGATGYYLVHNHPSGDPTPSATDRRFTRAIQQLQPGFLGHLVIDTGTYAVIARTGDVSSHAINNDARLHAASVPHEVIGAHVDTPQAVRDVADRLRQPGGVTLIYASKRAEVLIVRAVETVPVAMLANPEMAGFLRNRRRAYGALGVVAYVDPTDRAAAIPLYAKGHLLDIVSSEPPSATELGVPQRADETPTPSFRVQEEKPSYQTVDPADLVAMAEILITYVDDGITEFDAAWRQFTEDAPDLAPKLQRAFELAWEELRGEVQTVAAIKAPTQVSEDVPADQRAVRLYTVFQAAVNEDKLPKDPRELRAFAQKFVGGDPTTYTDDITDAVEAALTKNAPKFGQGRRLPGMIEAAHALEAKLPRAARSLEKLDLQQFSTPLPIAVAAQYAANVQPSDVILEPTAGTGHLVSALDPTTQNILVRELSPRRVALLKALGFHTTEGDYLTMTEKANADVVITNPPWGKYSKGKYGQAIAIEFTPVDVAERFVAKNVRDLKAGGRLVAIMPTTMLKSPGFQHMLKKHGAIRAIIQSPPGAYETRSTSVDSLLLVWDKLGGPHDVTPTNRMTPEAVKAAVSAVGERAPKSWEEYADLVARIPPRAAEGARPGQRTETGDADGRPVAPAPTPVRADGGGSGGTGSGLPQSGGHGPVGSPRVPGRRDADVVAPETGGERRELDRAGTTPRAARTATRDATRGLSDDGLAAFRQADASAHFAPYRLRSDLAGQRHPKLVVEARALSGVPYPELTITPTPRVAAIITSGRVSIEQAEQAMAAVQANIVGRHGYLAADNVGVGKSREIALTILDLMDRAKAEQRELRLLVTTYNRDTEAGLIDTEMLQEVLAGEDPGFEIVKVRDLKDAKKTGTEYTPLPRYPHAIYVVDSFNLRAYRQALEDVNLQGVIGDEVHTYKNSDAAVGATWQTLHAQIMTRVPRAHQAFAYFTATPAQSVYDYRYLYGLREWPIDGFGQWTDVVTGQASEEEAQELAAAIEAGAFRPEQVAGNQSDEVVGGDSEDAEQGQRRGGGENIFMQALSPSEAEQIPREWKVKGKFSSRDLWREGTEFVVETRPLKIEHRSRYDKFARLARDIFDAHRQFGALDKSGRRSMFGPGASLQFAAKRLQMQPAIEEAIVIAQEHVAQGYQAVLSLINVNESDPQAGNIRAAIEQINTRQVDKTEDGELVDVGDIPEALVRKAELLEQAAELGVLDNPIDLVAKAFGPDKVANIIGGAGKNRTLHAKEFQAGTRSVAVISAAGTTGINLDHRVNTGKGVGGRRVFIDVQYEWSATKAVQRYGRVDRTSNITPPKIIALNFGSATEKKFLATVANRMSALGALSKGGAESTGASALEEFEITGQDALLAAQNTWDRLTDSDKAYWKGRVFRDPGNADFPARHTTADMRQIQLALLWLPTDKANAFWEAFVEERARIREAMGFLDERRARRYRGEILREVELDPQRTIVQVKNDNGERFGILQGVVMPEMPRVSPYLRDGDGNIRRRYVTFTASDGRIVAGLEVPWMRVKAVARLYGALLQGEALSTPAKVLEALHAGEKVTLTAVVLGGKGDHWVLRERKDGKIVIDGAKMADREMVLKHGGAYSPVGNFWHVKDLEKFLERFPAKGPEVELELTSEDPDDDTADSISAPSATRPAQAKPRFKPVVGSVPNAGTSSLIPTGPTAIARPTQMRPVTFPLLVELAGDLIGIPQVVRAFRKAGKMGEFSPRGIKLHAGLFRRGMEQELAEALAHEIGHLADWLPHHTMKRGNLLGRLFSLRKYLKHKFTMPSGTEIENKVIRQELIDFSDVWRPWDPKTSSASYATYRKKAEELYADAISGLLVNPGLLERHAPHFYKAFFEGLDTKPEVKRAFFAVQDILDGTPEELIARNHERVLAMFGKGDAAAMDIQRLRQAQRAAEERDVWTRFRIEHIDKHTAFYIKAREAEKRGAIIPPSEDPRHLLSERNYLGGKLKGFVERHIQPIYETLDVHNLSWHTFSAALYYERVMTDPKRTEMANPLGLAPKDAAEARKQEIYDKLTPEQRIVLNDQIEAFRAAMARVASAAYDAGLYSDEMYREMQKNPAYATYRVLEFIDNDVSSTIFRQKGTLKEIQNVADATILKALVTIAATEHNLVKVGAFDFLNRHFPAEIAQAEERWNGKTQAPVEPRKGTSDRRVLVTYKEKGRLRGKLVDPYIGTSLNNDTIASGAIVRALGFLNSHWFRPVFTSLNLGFQSFNVRRDFGRTWKATPGMTLGRLVKRYWEAKTLARVRAFGLPSNPTAKQKQAYEDLIQAEESGILGLTYNDLIAGRETDDTQIEETLAKFGIAGYGVRTPQNPVVRGVKAVTGFIEKLGNVIETLPKGAVMYEFKGRGEVRDIPADQRAFIRERVGTPDIAAGGTRKQDSNNLFLFSNAITQGIRADIKTAVEPTTRGGFWWKTAAIDILPKLVLAAIAYGWVAGDDDEDEDAVAHVRKMLRNIPEYDKTNYTPIPLWLDENGATVYIRLPHDDTGRLLSGLAWKVLGLAKGDPEIAKIGASVVDYVAGQAPSATPTIGVARDVIDMASGRNPYDAYRSRPVFTDDEFAAGGWPKVGKFIGYEFQAVGGAIAWKFIAGEQRPREKTGLQTVLELPVLSDTVGRWLKVSSYGEAERLRGAQQGVAQDEARERLTERAAVNDAITLIQRQGATERRAPAIQEHARRIVMELYGGAPTKERVEQLKDIRKKLQMGLARGSADPLVDTVLSARSNDQKIAVLKEAADEMSKAELQAWLTRAVQQDVISPAVRIGVLRELR